MGKGKNKNNVLPSICEQIWESPEFGMTLKRENRDPSQYECGETKCKVCDEYYLENIISHQYANKFGNVLNVV